MLPKMVRVKANLDSYLKIRKAAAFLGVHPDTLRRWEAANKLVSYRHPLNRYRLYRQQDLNRILAKVQKQ